MNQVINAVEESVVGAKGVTLDKTVQNALGDKIIGVLDDIDGVGAK